MNDTKKKILEEIDKKIARKKEMALRAIERNTIDAFVMAFITNIEEINTVIRESTQWASLAVNARECLHGQLQSIDPRCKIEIIWVDPMSNSPQVNGILIKWSEQYIQKHNCDSELFVDIATLLFK